VPDTDVPDTTTDTGPNPSTDPIPVTEETPTETPGTSLPSSTTTGVLAAVGGTAGAAAIGGSLLALGTGATLVGINKYNQNNKDNKEAEEKVKKFSNAYRIQLKEKLTVLNNAKFILQNSLPQDKKSPLRSPKMDVKETPAELVYLAKEALREIKATHQGGNPPAVKHTGIINRIKDFLSIRRNPENRQNAIDKKANILLSRQLKEEIPGQSNTPIIRLNKKDRVLVREAGELMRKSEERKKKK
jgi:hypothetical protein